MSCRGHQNSRWRCRDTCSSFRSWHGWWVVWLQNKKVDLSYYLTNIQTFWFCCFIFFPSLFSGVIIDSSIFHITLRYITQYWSSRLKLSMHYERHKFCTRAKRAWQNLDVRSGYSKQQHPSFVPQGQISQKPLRKVMPLILHTQPIGCYWTRQRAKEKENLCSCH